MNTYLVLGPRDGKSLTSDKLIVAEFGAFDDPGAEGYFKRNGEEWPPSSHILVRKIVT